MSFTGKDLALFLPDQVGDAYSMRHTHDADAADKFEPLKPKIDASKKVTRYFPQQAPKWIEEEEGISHSSSSVNRTGQLNQYDSVGDRRLQRLAAVNKSNDDEGERDESEPPRRRRIYEATVIEDEPDDSIDFNDVSNARGSRGYRSDDSENEFVDGDAPIAKRIEEHAEEDEEAIAARRQRVRDRC